MPSLQVRELPEHIYQALAQEAEMTHRSLAKQAVAVLAKGLNLELEPRVRRKAILDAIRAATVQKTPRKLPNPSSLIREDRDR